MGLGGGGRVPKVFRPGPPLAEIIKTQKKVFRVWGWLAAHRGRRKGAVFTAGLSTPPTLESGTLLRTAAEVLPVVLSCLWQGPRGEGGVLAAVGSGGKGQMQCLATKAVEA